MTRQEAGRLSGISRRLPEIVISKMIKLRELGYSYDKISYILDEYVSTVYRYCKKAGL